MSTVKKYSREDFRAIVNGIEYRFKAYTTSTRYGFCHTVVSLDYDTTDTKVSYYNRTWERFRYETALRSAIRKFPRAMQDSLTAQLIERKAADEHDRADAMFSTFKRLHDGLTDENKARLQNLPPIQTEEQAGAVMGLMGLMTLMQ